MCLVLHVLLCCLPGTSPLYAYQAVFTAPPTRAEVLAASSLFFWTLTLIVLVKYVGIIIRFDDNGEGKHYQQRNWCTASAAAMHSCLKELQCRAHVRFCI